MPPSTSLIKKSKKKSSSAEHTEYSLLIRVFEIPMLKN